MSQLTLDFGTTKIAAPVVVSSGFTLRDYQQQAHDTALRMRAEGAKGVLVRQPTGTGKTVVGSAIAETWLAQDDDNRALVLADKRVLITQFADEIESLIGIRPGLEMGNSHVCPEDIPRITVASKQTLYEETRDTDDGGTETVSRLYKFNRNLNWLVILDEAHCWAYQLKSCCHIFEWFDANPLSWFLGLTATPLRGDGISLAKRFPDVACDYRLFDIDGGPSAVRDGWCVSYDQRFIVVQGVDFKNLKEVAGDFTNEELDAVLSEREAMMSMVQPLLDLVENRRTLVFCPTIAHAKLCARTINAEIGRTAANSLDGRVPEMERRNVYARHQRGDFQFLIVCGLCREGYNDPGIGAVAVFRPTKSRTLAEQMKGRGCRPLRGVVDGLSTPEQRLAAIAKSAKPDCMIVDLVGITGLADCASTAHILAAGKPDEVIDRANENAQKKDGPIDLPQEIREAEKEITAERIEREHRERKEAERRAKIQTDVQYSERQVAQGEGGMTTRKRRDARMAYGKFAGRLVSGLPDWYLECKKDKVSDARLKSAINREIEKRASPTQGATAEDVNRMLMEVG